MKKFTIAKEKHIPTTIAGLIFLISLVALFSPAEQTLGNWVKLIYVHGALIWVGIFAFSLAGVLALLYIFFGRKLIYQWSKAFENTAILLWIINIFLSMLSMQLIWGAVVWREPRMTMVTRVLAISLIIFLVSTIVEKPRVVSLLYLLMAVFLWFFLARTGVIIHPPSTTITGSSSLMIKASFTVIVLLFLLIALQIARLVKRAGGKV